MNMIRFLVALFLAFGLPLFAAQSNYVPVIGTQPVSPVIYAANPLANFATTNTPEALTNIIRDLAGTNSGGSGSYIQNRGGFGTNTVFFDRTTTDTNSFHAYGAGDPLANGVYFLAGHFPASQLTVYTNENRSGYAFAYAGPINVGSCAEGNFTLYTGTNGDPCIGDWPPLYYTSATNVAWTLDGGTAPAPTLAGWGQFYPAITVAGSIIGNGGGLTNINAAANNLAAVGGQAGTLSSPFIHIRTNGITINNTNWIYQGNVSGSRVTITNGDFNAYSTNGAFANVRVFDQILFNDINVQAVVHKVISSSRVQCWQLDVESEGVSSGGVTNSANWYLIPYLLKLTDFTVGAENRPTVFDSNGSLRLTSIGNQGIVGFHHYNNGTAMQIGAGSSILSGLQMGPNGMYFAISSVGSNFANADQFVMPSETLREAQVFATNGSPTFQYGVTNIKGGNFDIRVKAVGLAGFEGSGASLTNLPAQTNSNTALLNRDPQTFTGANTFPTVSATTLNVSGAVGLAGPVNFTNAVTMQSVETNTSMGTGIIHSDANGKRSSSAVNLSGADVTGILAAARAGSITQHTDVKITGTAPTPGQILQYDGVNWTNAPAPSGGSSFPLAGDANFNTFNPTNFTQAIGKLGSAGTPTYTGAGITDTGIYFIGDPEIDFSIGGVRKVAIDRFGELIALNGVVVNNVITLSVSGSSLTWNAGTTTYPLPAIQAGHTNVTTGTSVVITFPVVMPSTNYTALCTSVGASLAGYFPSGKTVNGFTANFTIITASDIDWQVIQHTQ